MKERVVAMRHIFYAAAVLLIVMAPLKAAEQRVPESASELQLSFAPLVKKTGPAVVNVYARTKVKTRSFSPFADDPFFKRFFGEDAFGVPRERVQNSLGSGVVVDVSGILVTNYHVVREATDIRVVLPDRREFAATTLVTDERSDLAVLKIEAGRQQLPSLDLGDSDKLAVGDLVLAIGNPFGVGQTVTSGIVSALARTEVGISDYQFFIQTDAAINPGNSGGALVNLRGELVGINTAIFSRTGGSIGIGFAIPSNMVRMVVQSALTGEKIVRPWLGAELQDVTSEIADSIGLERPQGALVAALQPESPLALAGLKQGDLLLALNGHDIGTAKEFIYRVATNAAGTSVVIRYLRGGREKEARVLLAAAPETIPRAVTKIDGNNPLAGLTVVNLSPAVSEELGVKTAKTGVAITDVGDGQARRLGFRKGDVILDINGTDIDSVETLSNVLAEERGYWSLAVNRNGRLLRLRVSG
ncbi:MAG TPA: DegQ family serine endoprotease [Aestuariivirgaceae bacterium]|jgi:Do/DeqQ family serine protease